MRYFSHLKNAAQILDLYSGREPFHHFLKAFFKTDKKYGSKDRRQIGQLCYGYFRLGRAFEEYGKEEQMVVALFLSVSKPDEMLEVFRPGWNQPELLSDTARKLSLLQQEFPSFKPLKIFPFESALSEGIDAQSFAISHLQQPDLFIRLRPGISDSTIQSLQQLSGFVSRDFETCMRFSNSTRLEEQVEPDREVVVQDISSQRTEAFFPAFNEQGAVHIWDCCAASGGKSILAFDHYHEIRLTVTDKRESILANLRQRFRSASIHSYESMVTDLGKPDAFVPSGKFDLLLADLPCSGSGTWGRNPENLRNFAESRIDEYQDLQRRILSNVVASIRPGGYLLYITCSVFKKENEENIEWLEKEWKLTVQQMGIIAGYELRGDTMFAALCRMP